MSYEIDQTMLRVLQCNRSDVLEVAVSVHSGCSNTKHSDIPQGSNSNTGWTAMHNSKAGGKLDQLNGFSCTEPQRSL